MTYLHLAFFMGLFSSVHCVAMCGPLLLTVNKMNGYSVIMLINTIIYHLARILTYGVLGLVLGGFGFLAVLQGWQQGFSIATGIILLVFGVGYILGTNNKMVKLQSFAIQPFVKLVGKWLNKPGGVFFVGVLNGILPCGLVYVALASAMNSDSLVYSFLFMILFGLGTLPLLFLVTLLGGFPRSIFTKNFSKLIPVFYIIIGVWFVLRGANFDIHYLSPALNIEGAIYCR